MRNSSAVCAARRVDLYGVGASGLVAHDLHCKLHRIGLTSFSWADPHLALTSAAMLRETDVRQVDRVRPALGHIRHQPGIASPQTRLVPGAGQMNRQRGSPASRPQYRNLTNMRLPGF